MRFAFVSNLVIKQPKLWSVNNQKQWSTHFIIAVESLIFPFIVITKINYFDYNIIIFIITNSLWWKWKEYEMWKILILSLIIKLNKSKAISAVHVKQKIATNILLWISSGKNVISTIILLKMVYSFIWNL